MPVKGVSQLKINTKRIFESIEQERTAKAVYAAITEGEKVAVMYTPVDTSHLINNRHIQQNTTPNGYSSTLTYDADYAIYVHAMPEGTNFQKASAEPQFLNRGFADAKADIDKAVLAVMKL